VPFSSLFPATTQWHSQDLVVVAALEGEVWGGVFPFHGKRIWGGGYAPSSENFRIFGVRMTCFGAFLALFLVTE